MNDSLLEFWQGRKPSLNNFAKEFAGIHGQMKQLEDHKYLPPKFSVVCKDMADYLTEQIPSFQGRRSPSPATAKTLKTKHEKSRMKLSQHKSSQEDSPPPLTATRKTPSPIKVRRSSYYDSIFTRALNKPIKKSKVKATYFPLKTPKPKESLDLFLSQLI